MDAPKHILITSDSSETVIQLYEIIADIEKSDDDFAKLDYYQKLSIAVGIQRNSLMAIISDVSIQI
jgi:hypothetical protein